jgi:hypothetical protein
MTGNGDAPTLGVANHTLTDNESNIHKTTNHVSPRLRII